tara:strand:- start:5307 stop:6653 length:1347 start_codon:yes stop_codon:yes gene_type:complete
MTHNQLKFGLILAVSLHAFDELVLTIALPTIVHDLGGSDWYGISLASYILASLISVVWAGTSIDQRGPVRIFLIGYALFAIGLVLAALSTTMMEFVMARAMQGLGGGISWTIAYSITNIVIPSHQRPRMIAWLDSAWLIPSLLAPTAGGYIVDYLDWHWVFMGQLPFLLIAAAILYPHLKPLAKNQPATTKSTSVNDLWQAIRIAAGAGLLITIMAKPIDWLWLLAIPVSLMIAWRPLVTVMPRGFMLIRPGLAASVMLLFLIEVAFFLADLFLPLMMIEVRQLSSSVTGLAFTCCAITWVGASFFQAWLSSRLTVHQSLMAGGVFSLIGIALLASLLYPQVPFWMIYVAWGVEGFGMGLAFNTAFSATMDYTKKGEEGATSTATGIAGSLSMGLAAGIGGAIVNHGRFTGSGLSDALGMIWLLAGIISLISLWVIYSRFKTPPKPIH